MTTADEEIDLPASRSNRPVTIANRLEYMLALALGAFFRLVGVDAASAIAGGFTRLVGPLIAPISNGLVALGGPSTQPDAPWSRRLVAAGAPFAASPSSVDTARATHYPALSRVLDVNWGRGSPAPALVLVGDRDPRDTFPGR